LLIFDEVTDKTKLAPFFMAHCVVLSFSHFWLFAMHLVVINFLYSFFT